MLELELALLLRGQCVLEIMAKLGRRRAWIVESDRGG
jgi:hypothetical protein